MMLRELTLVYGAGIPSPLADTQLLNPVDSVALVRPLLHDQPSERFLVIPLTIKYKPLGFRAFDGTLTSIAIEPGDVLRTALLANAPCVLVAHNHPSGDPTPSDNDKRVTAAITAAATLLNVTLIDHIIIGDQNRYASFKEMGLL